MNFILEYWNEIETGKVVVSKRVYKVYKKLVNEIKNSKGDWIFDIKKASKPIEFIEMFCRQSKGEWIGKSVKLVLFQKAFIQALFGFVNKDTGLRKFKEAFFLVGRKNGKSTLLSGIMLYMLMADGEGGAQIVSAATKKEQASIVFSEAVNMVN